MNDLSVLRKDANNVTFGQFVRQPASEYLSRVFILVMPGFMRPSHTHIKLSHVHGVQILHIRYGIHLEIGFDASVYFPLVNLDFRLRLVYACFPRLRDLADSDESF